MQVDPLRNPAPRPDFAAITPSRPAFQLNIKNHINGISAVQLAWWFQHIADTDGRYWKTLSPQTNISIGWDLNPRDDAHQVIGAVLHIKQKIADDTQSSYLQFQDYITNRSWKPGSPQAVFPSSAYPDDYQVPYPSPLIASGMGTIDPRSTVNGFNEQLLMTDGLGFSQGRLLFSWINTGSDDTGRSSAAPGVDTMITLYLPWMEDDNHPEGGQNGYAYDPAQSAALLDAWQKTLSGLPETLPRWFNDDTQDDQARAKG